MTSRIEQGASIDLEFTNVQNHPVSGKLQIGLGKLKLNYPALLHLSPHEIKKIRVPIQKDKPEESNAYPLTVYFDGGKNGEAIHYEVMHVNLISKLTIKVDGNLEDWKNALPQTVYSKGSSGVSVTEAAWYPFKNFSTKDEGYSNGYLAYDSEYFYFAAKTADHTPNPGTYRFTTRDDNSFFYPDTSFKMNPWISLKSRESISAADDGNNSALQTPDGRSRILGYMESTPGTNSYGLHISTPRNKAYKMALYFPNLDIWKVVVDIYDNESDLLLCSHTIEKIWQGAYGNFTVSGNLRIEIQSVDWWYTAKLAAVFFDSASEVAGGNQAVFNQEDLDTKGNWKTHYGSAGYYIVGVEKKLPDSVDIQNVQIIKRDTLIWPQGVRHFSYRKDPVLPDNSGLGFSFDNVLIAFNAIPVEKDELLPNPPGTMTGFTGYKCTDYEYALNPVAALYGGGTEIWRLLAPGMNRKHFFPRQPKSDHEGAVAGKLVIKRGGNTLITECAIPWSEIPDVKKLLDEGKKIKFSFRVNDDGSPESCMELAKDRSVSKQNSRAFHPDWKTHWANEVEFGFER
jgi:hypothetical protein